MLRYLNTLFVKLELWREKGVHTSLTIFSLSSYFHELNICFSYLSICKNNRLETDKKKMMMRKAVEVVVIMVVDWFLNVHFFFATANYDVNLSLHWIPCKFFCVFFFSINNNRVVHVINLENKMGFQFFRSRYAQHSIEHYKQRKRLSLSFHLNCKCKYVLVLKLINVASFYLNWSFVMP